ncbi:MAG: Cna B-type domain-containing protein [Clostridium sp.]|nr:Cna B-type domain-containing protein [Clostridium sp.]
MKRTVSGSLAALMTAISVLSTSGAVPAYASEAKVKLSYQQENMEKIGLYVQAENESFAPGEEVNLTIYIQNNSNQPLTEGTLKWVDKKETLQNAAFVYETEDGEAEEKATPDSAQEETTEAEEVEESEDLGTPEASEELGTPEGAEAPEETKAAGPASDFGQDDGITVEEDWFEDEEEDSADDAEQSGPYLDEDGYVRNISLAPGEIFQIPFTAIVNEDIFGIRTRDIRFTFGARTPDNKRLSNYVKYQFNTGLMTMQPIELVGGNQVETNEENTMIFRLDMDDIEYMFEDDGSASKASDSNAIASASEAEVEFTPAEVIDSETEKATPSEAEKATASEAEKETPEAEEAASEAEKATASEAKQEEEKAEEENEGIFRPEEVKYSIETYGVRLKGVKARFDEEASGPAESVTEVSYRVASDTKPGFYFGKVTASVRYNGNTYKTEQGFVMNVTGEGQMQLKGMFNGAEVVVCGPAESFPDGEILSLKVSEISGEQRIKLEEAVKKLEEETGTTIEEMTPMDIKVISDGEPQELRGPVTVTFADLKLENRQKDIEEHPITQDNIAVWHLDEDEISLNEVDSSVDDDGNIIMTAEHFSVYMPSLTSEEDSIQVVEGVPVDAKVKIFNYDKTVNTCDAPLCKKGFGFYLGGAPADWVVDSGTSGGLGHLTMNPLLTKDGYPSAKISGEDLSMDYLFRDSGDSGSYWKGTMEDGGGLFRKDGGYYYYDSALNSAYYDEVNKKFTLYNTVVRPHYTGNGSQIPASNFLPFNEVIGQVTVDQPNQTPPRAYLNGKVDLWFGMSVEFDFFMPKDGLLDGAPMKFEFLGDDDVFVYIDDVLVLDIGGTHAAQKGTIDFSTGYCDSPYKRGHLSSIFKTAKGDEFKEYDFNGYTFEDYSKHTLKFFYMERGGNISYCKLRFNMPTIPDGSLNVSKELDGPTEVADYLKANMEYRLKVVKAGSDGKATDELFIHEGDPYKILGVEETQYVGEGGIFTLKAGQTAQFVNMPQLGGSSSYIVQEIMPKVVAGQYGDVEYLVAKDGGQTEKKNPDGTEVESGNFKTYDTEPLSPEKVQIVSYRNRIETSQLQKIKVTKVWEGDENNVCGCRPASVKFQLYTEYAEDGVKKYEPFPGEGGLLTLTGNSWTGEFKDLPKYNTDGTEIIYKVKELNADGAPVEHGDTLSGKQGTYTSAYEMQDSPVGYLQSVKVTNTHQHHSISVEKQWSDGNEKHQTEPVLVGLYKNGKPMKETETLKPVLILTYANGTISGQYKDLVPAKYTVKELAPVADNENPDFTVDGRGYRGIDHNGRLGDFYKVTYSFGTNSITECDAKVTINNTLSKATIKVGKWIDNYSLELEKENFMIRISVPDRNTKSEQVLAHGKSSGGIEVYAGDDTVDVNVSEIVPMEYQMTGVSVGTESDRGESIEKNSAGQFPVPVTVGETTVLWVHNLYTPKHYFHNSDDKLNRFDPIPGSENEAVPVEQAALIPEHKEWEFLNKPERT